MLVTLKKQFNQPILTALYGAPPVLLVMVALPYHLAVCRRLATLPLDFLHDLGAVLGGLILTSFNAL